jgi:hypothetical protein
MQILSQGKYQNAEISNLLTKSKVSQRGVELHFVDLSVFENNQTDKVLETARKLETTIPLLNAGKSI